MRRHSGFFFPFCTRSYSLEILIVQYNRIHGIIQHNYKTVITGLNVVWSWVLYKIIQKDHKEANICQKIIKESSTKLADNFVIKEMH